MKSKSFFSAQLWIAEWQLHILNNHATSLIKWGNMKLARFSSILSTSVKNTIIKLSVQWLSNLCTLSAPPFFSLWIINPYESCHYDRDRLWNCLIMLTQVVTSFGDFCFFLQHLFKDNCKLLDVTEQIKLLAMRRQVPEARGVHPQWAGKKGIHQLCYQPWGWRWARIKGKKSQFCSLFPSLVAHLKSPSVKCFY